MLKPLVIVGPTASGKSALALSLATTYTPAEIISADAMAVYRQMDIGTAKPSVEEREAVPYHLVDVVDSSATFALSQFQELARQVLVDCQKRRATPLIVGGTGLYVQAVVDNFTIPGQFPDVRAQLEQEPTTELLWQQLDKKDPVAAAKMEPTNRRRILRALEVTLGSGQPFSSFGPGVDKYPANDFCQVGLDIDRDVLDNRINQRFDAQLKEGFLEEAKRLHAGNLSKTARQALGYKEFFAHLDGQLSFEEAVAEAKQRIRRFARRQQRWFRRDPRITWFDATDPDLAANVAAHWNNR